MQETNEVKLKNIGDTAICVLFVYLCLQTVY